MNMKAYKSFLVGFILLIFLAVVTVLYLENRADIKVSRQSAINANSYVIGVDYSGLITKELVERGQYVKKGDQLAYIKSSGLLQDLNSAKISYSDLFYPLSEDRQIILLATQDGTVADINFLAGSYVPANQDIFKITANQAPFVISKFNLSIQDFRRLTKDNRLRITLPNGRSVISPITSIAIDNANPTTGQTVNITLQSTIDPDGNLIIGSPVTATLYLSNQTYLQKVLNFIKGW